MKKLFLIAAIILSANVIANAQLKFGIKAGANFASINLTDDKMLLGYHGGFLAQIKFANFGIQPEVLFSIQGAGMKDFSISDMNVKLNYINVPVMLQYYVIPKLLAIELGPQFGILLSAKSTDTIERERSTETDIKENSNTIDFSACGGLSFQLPIIPLGIFARYTLGFTNIKKDAGDDAGKNHVIQIGAFFKF